MPIVISLKPNLNLRQIVGEPDSMVYLGRVGYPQALIELGIIGHIRGTS